MKKVIVCICMIVMFLIVYYASADDARKKGFEILVAADRRLYPENGTYDIDIINTDEMSRQRDWEMEIYKNGREQQTLVWKRPGINKNDVAIRKFDLIHYKPVRAHKATIQSYKSVFLESDFSWGDIASCDIAYDYTTEKIEQLPEDDKTVAWLILKPLKEEYYARIDIWIDLSNYNTLRRIYYTASGEVLKEARYYDIVERNGKVVSFKIRMEDDFLGTFTVAEIMKITENNNLPRFLFEPANISRIRTRG